MRRKKTKRSDPFAETAEDIVKIVTFYEALIMKRTQEVARLKDELFKSQDETRKLRSTLGKLLSKLDFSTGATNH